MATEKNTTQTKHSWRASIRTGFQAFVGLCVLLPLLVQASGLDQTSGAVLLASGVAAGVAKIMNLPGVNAWIQQYVPWLAAEPKTPVSE